MSMGNTDFVWHGLALHLGKPKTPPVLTLSVDIDRHHLFRIKYPDGWLSSPANLTRAKDAAYGHARYLLGKRGARRVATTPKRLRR
jgi:hypothetical protein